MWSLPSSSPPTMISPCAVRSHSNWFDQEENFHVELAVYSKLWFEFAELQSEELHACINFCESSREFYVEPGAIKKAAECGKCEKYAVQNVLVLSVSVLSYTSVTPNVENGKLLYACNWWKQVPWRLYQIRPSYSCLFYLPTQRGRIPKGHSGIPARIL